MFNGNLLIGTVTDVFAFETDDKETMAMVTVSEAVRIMARGCEEKDFPANGLVAAFEIKRSSGSGKTPQLVRWGVPMVSDKQKPGELFSSDSLNVDWRFTVEAVTRKTGVTW